jgi:SAM-dependent methyltransferase
LAAHGVDAFGIDASASMVATACRLNPTLQFCQGDFFHLPFADGALAGVAAFYCLIHCGRGELSRAVVEIHRVLMPGGRFLMAVHAGEGEVGRDEAYGKRIALVATLFTENEVCTALTAAGFRVNELVTREPYPFEYPSRRIYATAVGA